MRIITTLALGLAGLTTLAGCATQPPPDGDPARCVAIFQRYDQVARMFPQNGWGTEDNGPLMPAPVSQQAGRLISAGCLTMTDDLAGMERLAADPALLPAAPSGAAIAPTAVHVGVLTSISDVGRAEAFFGGLGYRTRSIGVEQLGRRLYIGPFTSQGQMDQAIATARRAGFTAAYPSDSFRFWGQ